MKTTLLSLFVLFATALVAEEPEVKMDPMRAAKDRFASARKRGWDLSNQMKPAKKEKKTPAFQFITIPPKSPMITSEHMVNVFRDDLPESEKCAFIERLNELNRPPSAFKN